MLRQQAQFNIINGNTHISGKINDDDIYRLRDLKSSDKLTINISGTNYTITKTPTGYYSIIDSKTGQHKILYAYTIENGSEFMPTTKAQDINSFNAPVIFSPLREILISEFLLNLKDLLTKISQKEYKSQPYMYVFKTTYNEQPAYIKMFYKLPYDETITDRLLYEQQIYNYLKHRDARIKKIYKNYFIEMIDIFKIEINPETETILTQYITAEQNEQRQIDLRILKNIFKTAVNKTIYFLITKDNNVQSVQDYLYTNINAHTITDNDLIEIIFEILYVIYLMNIRLNIKHNDLHFNNIMIKKLESPEIQEYRINNKIYTRNKQFQIYVYDFDLSYLDKHPNEFIKRYARYGINNTHNNSRDIWTLIKVLDWFQLSLDIKKIIFNILLNSNIELNEDDDILINATNAKQLLLRHRNYNEKTQWAQEMCANFPREKDNLRCDEPDFKELHPDVVIDRYISKFKANLNFINENNYLQKYLKIKQKYLKLKHKYKQ